MAEPSLVRDEDFRFSVLRDLKEDELEEKDEVHSDLSEGENASVVGSDVESLLEVVATPPYGFRKRSSPKDFYELLEEENGTFVFHNSEIFGSCHPAAKAYEVLRRDVTNLLIRFCDGEATFDHFVKCWKEKKFSLIFCTKNTFPDIRSPVHYLFYNAKKYLVRRLPMHLRVGGVFLLYALFTQQPASAFCKHLERIQLTLAEFREVFKPLYMDFKHGEKCQEALYVFCRLFGLNAFEFSCSPQKIIGPFLMFREVSSPKPAAMEKQLRPFFQNLVKELAELEKEYESLVAEVAARPPGEREELQAAIEGLQRRREQTVSYVKRQMGPLFAPTDTASKTNDEVFEELPVAEPKATNIGERRRLLKHGGSHSLSPNRLPRFLRSSANPITFPNVALNAQANIPSETSSLPDGGNSDNQDLMSGVRFPPALKRIRGTLKTPSQGSSTKSVTTAASPLMSDAGIRLRTNLSPQKVPTTSKAKVVAQSKSRGKREAQEDAAKNKHALVKKFSESNILQVLELQAIDEATESLNASEGNIRKSQAVKVKEESEAMSSDEEESEAVSSDEEGSEAVSSHEEDASGSASDESGGEEQEQIRRLLRSQGIPSVNTGTVAPEIAAKREKFMDLLRNFSASSLLESESEDYDDEEDEEPLPTDEEDAINEEDEKRTDEVDARMKMFMDEKVRVRGIIDKSKQDIGPHLGPVSAPSDKDSLTPDDDDEEEEEYAAYDEEFSAALDDEAIAESEDPGDEQKRE